MFYRELFSEQASVRLPTTSATTATIFWLWSGNVNGDLTTIKVATVERFDSSFGVSLICHLNERETALSSGFTILRNRNRNNLTVFSKEILQSLLSRFEREIPYKQFVIHVPYSQPKFDRKISKH
jgi:hypothetical protein